MRISDWSSDVCSSDLARQVEGNARLTIVGTVDRIVIVDARGQMEARDTEGGIKSGRCLAQRDGQAPPLLLRLQKCAGVDERTGQQLRARSPAIVECPLGQPSFVHGKAFGLDQKASAVVIERDRKSTRLN